MLKKLKMTFCHHKYFQFNMRLKMADDSEGVWQYTNECIKCGKKKIILGDMQRISEWRKKHECE